MELSIDREKVIKGLETCYCPPSKCEDCPYHDLPDEQSCNEVLCLDALAVLKEQKEEAKWIYGEDKTGVDGWRCSECGFFEPWFYEFTDDIDFIRSYGHCPRCGRKMTSYTGKPIQSKR